MSVTLPYRPGQKRRQKVPNDPGVRSHKATRLLEVPPGEIRLVHGIAYEMKPWGQLVKKVAPVLQIMAHDFTTHPVGYFVDGVARPDLNVCLICDQPQDAHAEAR